MAAVPNTQRGKGELRAFQWTVQLHVVLRGVHRIWTARRDHALMAFVGIPLAMIATALLGLWWAWFPLLAGAAISMPSWRWALLLTMQLGFIGSEWAVAGTSYLGEFPNDTSLIEVVWVAFPVALATVGHLNRHRMSSR